MRFPASNNIPRAGLDEVSRELQLRYIRRFCHLPSELSRQADPVIIQTCKELAASKMTLELSKIAKVTDEMLSPDYVYGDDMNSVINALILATRGEKDILKLKEKGMRRRPFSRADRDFLHNTIGMNFRYYIHFI